MAAPLPDRPATPPAARSFAVKGVVLGAAGLAALGAGLWLWLREAPAPALHSAAVPAAPPAPTASAPPPSAPPPSGPVSSSPSSPVAPAPVAPPAAALAPAAPQAVVPAPLPAPPAPPPQAVPVPAPAAPAPAAQAMTPPPPPATAPPPPAPAASLMPPQAPAAAPAPSAPAPQAVVPTPQAPAPPAAAPPAAATAPLAAPALPPPAVAPEPPRFDIVRVNAQGGSVMAGRAAPGAIVILRANGREIGRVRADAQGQWVLAGAAPLGPGAHAITVAMLDDAGREIAGEAVVEALVAAPPAAVAAAPQAPAAAPQPPAAAPPPPAPSAPIVVMTTPQGAPVLFQAPARQGGRLALDIVDYDGDGEIRFAGTAPPGSVVRLYVDGVHVGDVTSGADGRWSLLPQMRVAVGEHVLRLDQVDRAGKVVGRIEQPFERAAVAAPSEGMQRVVVQPRQNLWRISRSVYGRGVRYTEIFEANRDQIRDPARIYPGQVFVIPAEAAGASTPTSSSRSR